MSASIKPSGWHWVRVILLITVVACAWFAPFDDSATTRVDAGLKRAAVSYASARLLNSVISTLQGTEISATPVGVGMTFTPGQVLAPLNTLIEQFSDVMLIAMIAFGVEKMLLSVGASWGVSLIFSLLAAVWAACYLRGWSRPFLLNRLVAAFLLIRFAMPLALWMTGFIFQSFMASDYRESQQAMQIAQNEAGQMVSLRDPEDKTETGLWKRLKNMGVEVFSDARARLDRIKATAEHAVERIIRLMVIFVLETIVLPILFLWLLWGLAKGSLDIGASPGFLSRRKTTVE